MLLRGRHSAVNFLWGFNWSTQLQRIIHMSIKFIMCAWMNVDCRLIQWIQWLGLFSRLSVTILHNRESFSACRKHELISDAKKDCTTFPLLCSAHPTAMQDTVRGAYLMELPDAILYAPHRVILPTLFHRLIWLMVTGNWPRTEGAFRCLLRSDLPRHTRAPACQCGQG